ncbi:PilW family protein [Aeromonas hydrophila]|uniref:PilW family protein n=1 Tax=Aeromonas hydrophila TaxID=644 RepID=UPI003EC8B43E
MKTKGFTLIEWLIAMVIGVFLLGGVLSIYVASRATTEDVLIKVNCKKMVAWPCG